MPTITRRNFLFTIAATALGSNIMVRLPKFRASIAELEKRYGGTLSVVASYVGSDLYYKPRIMPLCSTHKALSAAFVLDRVDKNKEDLTRRVTFSKSDLVTYSPITSRHADDPNGMSMSEICDAAMTLSDNTAANLMLDSFGGPSALTAFLRANGDMVTRLDDYEPALNDWKPGETHNVTMPGEMTFHLQRFLFDGLLSPQSSQILANWMISCKTGLDCLRAGIPQSWTVGDKTGSGSNNTSNDVAVVWPPHGKPFIIAAYYTGSTANEDQRKQILAEVGRIAVKGYQA